MRSIKKLFALFVSAATLICSTGCSLITIDGENNGAASNYTGNGSIGLSVSTQNNPFFVTLVEGAQAAADENGVQLVVVDAGDDAAKQVSDIEDLIAKNVSVLIVNPVDSDTVSSVVQDAVNKGVKVISADRVVNGVDIDCQIASDNVLGAELATQYIVDKIGEGAKVAELQGTSGASAAIDRGAGFHNIADAKLEVVASQPADFDRTKGMTVMENMLQANGDIKAVFAANDEMALGAMEAIAASRKDILVVGFDATDDAIASIKDGKMGATIAQQPDLIGATSVKTAIRLMNGETVEKAIPVEVTLITAENAGSTGGSSCGCGDDCTCPETCGCCK
ncbi:MAG: substrate-binding domain-containing protein [Oscillospiraceae bacterium]|nr:substrate-binding domain-containing protein [Oscillospiraceae bacterium]